MRDRAKRAPPRDYSSRALEKTGKKISAGNSQAAKLIARSVGCTRVAELNVDRGRDRPIKTAIRRVAIPRCSTTPRLGTVLLLAYHMSPKPEARATPADSFISDWCKSVAVDESNERHTISVAFDHAALAHHGTWVAPAREQQDPLRRCVSRGCHESARVSGLAGSAGLLR